jgi:ribonuclease BN (tRNA processing enzyme)
VHIAREAGVRRLALFHHDPYHDDDTVDGLLAGARAEAGPALAEVLAAYEGLTIALSDRASSRVFA